MPVKRKRRLTKEEGPTHGELQQRLIDTYRKGYLELIKDSERILRLCQKQFEELENPKLKKRYEAWITQLQNDLRRLRDNTPEVLREAEKMQKNLDSLN